MPKGGEERAREPRGPRGGDPGLVPAVPAPGRLRERRRGRMSVPAEGQA